MHFTEALKTDFFCLDVFRWGTPNSYFTLNERWCLSLVISRFDSALVERFPAFHVRSWTTQPSLKVYSRSLQEHAHGLRHNLLW